MTTSQDVIEDLVARIEGIGDRKEGRSAAMLAVKQACIEERFEAIAKKFATRRWVPKYKGKKAKWTERWLNLLISDLHFGSDLDPRLVRYPYGPLEESRRLGAVFAQAVDYKRMYRAETSLAVHILGDIIQGNIHDPQSSADLTTQHDRALHHLIHAIEFAATEFGRVVVYTAVGNHGRDASRHIDRVMQDKYDSHEFRIYRALHYAFRHVPHVEVVTPMRPFYICQQFEHKGLFTHGDTIFNFGNPGKVVNIARLETQIGRFKTASSENANVSLFAGGHVHVASAVDVGTSTVVTNGCLLPNDQFAQSVGFYASRCSQQLWETVKGHQFGDHRRLYVGEDEDKNKALDDIIPPWKSLEG